MARRFPSEISRFKLRDLHERARMVRRAAGAVR